MALDRERSIHGIIKEERNYAHRKGSRAELLKICSVDSPFSRITGVRLKKI